MYYLQKKNTFKKIQGCRKVENKSARKVMSGKYQKKTSIAILISDELYFMVKKTQQENHYIMLKRPVNLEGMILVRT